VGRTRGFRRDGREFYSEDSHPKQIWMKSLRDDATELLRSETLPEQLRRFEKELPGKQVAKRLGFDGLRSLFSALQALKDPRSTKGRQYSLGCCLSIVVCAVMAGCKGLRECSEFGKSLTQKQREALRSWKNPKTRIYEAPGPTTLWRTVSGVDAAEFEQAVNGWFRDEKRLPEAIALDGKVLRATLQNEDGGACAVSAVSHPGTPLFSISSSRTPKAGKSKRYRS